MQSTRCGKRVGSVGEGDKSSFRHSKSKVNVTQPRG